jgi:hypothetical protein
MAANYSLPSAAPPRAPSLHFRSFLAPPSVRSIEDHSVRDRVCLRSLSRAPNRPGAESPPAAATSHSLALSATIKQLPRPKMTRAIDLVIAAIGAGVYPTTFRFQTDTSRPSPSTPAHTKHTPPSATVRNHQRPSAQVRRRYQGSEGLPGRPPDSNGFAGRTSDAVTDVSQLACQTHARSRCV